MSTAKHTAGPWKPTPGPWQANASELEACSPLVGIRTAPNSNYKICECGFQNAQLIAAAPDLLAACQAALAVLNDHDNPTAQLKAAITKAEGKAVKTVAGWSFHGVNCTKEQALNWRLSLSIGQCPWCGKGLSGRYANANRHLRTCPKKPS